MSFFSSILLSSISRMMRDRVISSLYDSLRSHIICNIHVCQTCFVSIVSHFLLLTFNISFTSKSPYTITCTNASLPFIDLDLSRINFSNPSFHPGLILCCVIMKNSLNNVHKYLIHRFPPHFQYAIKTFRWIT